METSGYNHDQVKKRALSGSLWAVSEKVALQFVQFGVAVYLARLLSPADFGLIALTTIFITVSGALADGGFEKALIQARDVSKIAINTVFYVNLIVSFGIALALVGLAPKISAFFGEQDLNGILRLLALGLPIDALGQTQRTLLMRELSFKKIAVSQVISSIAAGGIGIVLANFGYGVYALVYSTLLGVVVRVSMLWVKSNWYPTLDFSLKAISHLLPFGLKVLCSSILFFIVQQVNAVLIGRFYTKVDLGLFNRGSKFPNLISNTIQSIVLKMSLPLFSNSRDSVKHSQRLFIKSTSFLVFLTFPLLLFLFFYAEEITLVILGDKWLGAVKYLRLFCLISLFEPFISLDRELLLARGKAGLVLKIFLLVSVLEVIPMFFFIKHGVLSLIYISLISRVIQMAIYSFAVQKTLSFKLSVILKVFLPSILALFAVVCAMYALNSLGLIMSASLTVKLSLCLCISLMLYFLFAAIFKLSEFKILQAICLSPRTFFNRT